MGIAASVREVSDASVGTPGRFSMNRILNAIAMGALLAASAPSYAQQVTTKDQIIGTWKVVSLKGLTTGLVKYPLGEQPQGYVTVTPTRMWLLFVDSRRPAPASAALTDAEAIAAMKTSVAWTGEYTIGGQSADGLKATARVDTASSSALPGTDRVYFMKVEGNKLTMRSPGVIEPMTGVTSALVIELVKAD
jgi:lipocalin-like protein